MILFMFIHRKMERLVRGLKLCVMSGGKTPRIYTRILKYLEASPWF